MALDVEVKFHYGLSGLIIGGVITIIIGFIWGGWTTSITSQKKIEEAVLASQAATCTAQFKAQPNYEKKLKELGQVDSWKRSQFIQKGGWDKMPGQEKADYGVSQVCADGLEYLIKK